MTIEELVEKRKQLEDDILELVLKFESETDIIPTSIHMVNFNVPPVPSPSKIGEYEKAKPRITVRMEF